MENSEPVRLARYAIEERVTNGRVLSIPEWVSRELRTMMAGFQLLGASTVGALSALSAFTGGSFLISGWLSRNSRRF